MVSMFMRHYSSMHGVINTDNVSIMGLTIDYGPYAFMDVYNPAHICNHSDDTGRYSFAVSANLNLTCRGTDLFPIETTDDDVSSLSDLMVHC
jgi:uncharacterized protein YdiU (UPF0061 family)